MAPRSPDYKPIAHAVTFAPGTNLHRAPGSEQLWDALPPSTRVWVYHRKQQPKKLWAYVYVPARHECGWIEDSLLHHTPMPPPPPAPAPARKPRTSTPLVIAVVLAVSVIAAIFVMIARAHAQASWCASNCRMGEPTAEMRRDAREAAARRTRFEAKWGKSAADNYGDQVLKRVERDPTDPDCWQFTPKHC